ncbi:MAG: two-component system, OmpR family, sensor kinase [Solirubrobacteraceae bacterium]|nr:two-component system, OmpR family, sensor kinase [Solirubrobacteraceae bacterium]
MRRLRDRLALVGLRWRLAGWVTVVVLICTGISFVAVYDGTGSQVRQQIDKEILGDAGDLAHDLVLAEGRTPARIARAAESYVRDQSFAASSTVLFALVPGAPTATNRPELFSHSIPDNRETPATQSQENRRSLSLLTAPNGYSTLSLPDLGELRVLKRSVRLNGGLRATVGVGEPLSAVKRAQAGVARAFILAAMLALVGALLASYLIGTRVSRPLRRMAAVAARVDAGDLHPRIYEPGGEGHEVRVLAEAFNHMLDRLAEAFAGQQAFVADASHELRTPLTVIRGQLEVLAAQTDPSAAEVRRVEYLVQAEIARMSRLVDDLLLLARSEQMQFLRVEPIDLVPFVSELWDGVSLIADRRFELGPLPQGRLRADPDRLAQALRNLLDNAIQHTTPEHGLVRLQVTALAGQRVRFTVEDDGAGIDAAQRERVFDRLHRTDSARDRATGGAGLGLAIVRAIAEAHAGSVAARESPEGGACIELELSGFSQAAGAGASGAPERPVASARRL